jgi:GTP-binding protein
MAFIDEITITAKGGRGGDGVVRWRQEKFIAKGGPNGGDGGRGGKIIVHGVRNMHTLAKYSHKKEFKAEDGNPGEGGSRHGKDGKNLIIDLPVGSVITNLDTKERISLDTDGQKVTILQGGRGGMGNEFFKSSIHTTPTKATKGKTGEESDFHIELELFADIGLVGLPNAGKSSLLNAMTNAEAKIGDYAFTTLDPNLGDFYGHIIADIPGLIEGASEGRGLGTKFLKHIKRTKNILHLVSFENELTKAGGMMKVYKEIRKELSAYGQGLDEKEEVILLTKTDVIDDPKAIAKKVKEFEKLGKEVFTISLYDSASVEAFKKELIKMLAKS